MIRAEDPRELLGYEWEFRGHISDMNATMPYNAARQPPVAQVDRVVPLIYHRMM